MIIPSINEVNSLFQQPWWLEAVVPGQWGEVVVQKDGKISARLPYYKKHKLGLTLLSQPPLTQTLGPWLRSSTAKYANQLKEQKDLMEQLIEALPAFDYFVQNFSPEQMNWLPFYWAGFQSQLHYTYRIEEVSNLDIVWDGFRDNVRTDIRKANKLVQVRDDLGIDKFLDMHAMTFHRQNKKIPYSDELIKRVHEECMQRDCSRILFAEDASGKTHAAIYLVWDKDSTYYLMGGGNPELRNSGATSLLIWHAIQFSGKVSRRFDFEGSMIESVERFFRAFGARQVPYLTIKKFNRKAKILFAAQDLSKAIFTS